MRTKITAIVQNCVADIPVVVKQPDVCFAIFRKS